MSEAWKRNLPVPFFSQRENQYRWQRIARQNEEKEDGTGKYSGGETIGFPIPLASSSCNITSICMILHYYGIATDTPDEMMKKFYDDVFPNYNHEAYTNKLGDGANLKTFVHRAYNIPTNYIEHERGSKSITDLHNEIAKGYPVMISFGPTWTASSGDPEGTGHIGIIRGFTEQGDVIINDPWGDIASPYGFLNIKDSENKARRGVYYDNGVNRYYGLGNGDNCILRKTDLQSIMRPTNSNRLFNQTLVIRYPHVWAFPKKDYGMNNMPLFYFSSPLFFTTIRQPQYQKMFRDERMQLMLEHETIQDAGYPVSSHNRQWHDGIHAYHAIAR